jgi:hypothetical protein
MLSTKQNYSSNPLLIEAANNAVKKRIEREKGDAALMAQRAGILPDSWQSDLLRSDARQMILLCSRQSGKSTVSAILGLHTALFKENSLVLLLSPSLRQSQELFKKLKDFFAAIECAALPKVSEESALRLEFNNGSRVIALPGSETTIRGYSAVSLLIIDEASIVEDSLFFAVKPMLAVSGGRIILLSTPRGKRGFFHDVWTSGGADWNRTCITARECPRISEQWLLKEKESMPSFWFKQEFECEFVETMDSVFSYDDIHAAIDPSVKPLVFL